MPFKIVVNNPFEISIQEYGLPPLADHEVHIKTLFSGISAGTEMSQYRGTSPFLTKQWDATTRLFVESTQSTLSYPIENFGYEESGIVSAVGKSVKDIHPGQYIFGPWGHMTDYIADESYARDHLMPDGLDPICGIFSHIGAVALNGVHDAHIRIGDGDAGFGKTEVALRASFRAVMESKQVVILVPTTILAEQHYQTFSRRFRDYPVRVEVLNRFRTKAEQAKIVEGINRGTVDIIVGTHRLLQKDIQFKDLGLVVIDEEQRFGVTHKEKLKKL